MMYIEPEHRLSIHVTSTSEGDDIALFSEIIKKCATEAKKAGFKNMFTVEEKNLIKQLNEVLKNENTH